MAFAYVALFVGMFIIYNTFSIVVAQRTKEMAMLRAIGASRRQVLRSVLLESVVVGAGRRRPSASAAGVGLSFGLRALLGAVGLDIPSGDAGRRRRHRSSTAFVVGRRPSPCCRPSARPCGPAGSGPSPPCGTWPSTAPARRSARVVVGLAHRRRRRRRLRRRRRRRRARAPCRCSASAR